MTEITSQTMDVLGIFKYNGTTWTQLGNDIYGENSGDRISLSSKMVLSGDGLRVAIPSNIILGAEAVQRVKD
ncbi:MAG: hypothetical protein CM15mP114_15670 [Alphaproteobacteria bacterium]|nr:MAG: hypothetical protein CM15mP114_15670 [Alphaproteobacteria bacterium]